ncbi:MAG: hypothetical protein NTW29_07420 [Bacteroidetes bacterium]|nr:hypothetical protein [Bacteroidota bacterium]
MYRKLFLLFSLVCMTAFVQAQSYVTLHEHCNYSGKSYTLAPGTYAMYQMRIGNDQLSSLQMPDGFKVTLYEHDNFKGKSKTFTGNITCLEAEWNDMATSIVVESSFNPGYGQNDYVTFYNDSYHRGYSKSLRIGNYNGAQLGDLRYNISSLKISGNVRVRAYINNENMNGYYVTYDASQSSLPDNQNDKIGSLVVEYYNGPITNPGGGNTGNGSFATFFTDCSYDGNSIRLMPGYYDGQKLGLFKYGIASMQIPSNLRVKVFSNDNLYGSSSLLTDNISCLNYDMKNKIGSLVVEERGGWGGGGGGNNPPGGNEAVIIYADDNYRGQAATLLPGTYSTMAQASGFPDNALSSLQVPAGYRVVLYEFENFGGKSYTVTASKSGFSFSGWNDKASSVKVYRD